MTERKTGFAACKQCFEGEDEVDVRLCRKPSDVCPPIPKVIPDINIIDYLQAGIVNLPDMKTDMETDMVNHPPHYNSHPSGVECIQVTEHMSFNVGNAVKYLWRVDEKDNPFQDLDKAIWYIKREILKRTKEKENER